MKIIKHRSATGMMNRKKDADSKSFLSEDIDRRDFIKRSALIGVGTVVAWKLLGMNSGADSVFGPRTRQGQQDEWVSTTCWIGKQDCGMRTRVVDGRIVKFEGHPDHPRNKGSLCVKGMAQVMSVYDPYRIKAPLKRTNSKGETGQWQEISWDEALNELAGRINTLSDKKKFLWQKGRSKAEAFYDNAFVTASGATKLHNGGMGSGAGVRASEYTIGMHGVLHPDFRNCKYLLNWGWNMRNAGGNKTCWITWPREMLDARERGMKVVLLDPYNKNMGPFADEWYPIKPGTDLMFFLALSNQLISKGHVDSDYLTRYSNAPFLVKADGTFLRDTNDKELVWNTSSSSAVPYDEVGISPALEGNYSVNGVNVNTAFEVFKTHVAQYTPEVAAEVTGIHADDIKNVAEELGKNAMIGSTITIDGKSLPYRPVGIAAGHVAQQEMGFQAVRAALQVFMLLGAVYAPGGIRSDFIPKHSENFTEMETMTVSDPPYNVSLENSRYYPINSNNSSLIAHVMQDPAKYGVTSIPEVMVVHMTNMLTSFPDQDKVRAFLSSLNYIAVIDPWLSETADHYADLVLPAATIEKYEGPIHCNDQYEDAISLRVPPIAPMYQSRGEIDIYIDLCEKLGVLYGTGGYLDLINQELSLSATYMLDLNLKQTSEQIFDRWAKDNGYSGVDYFRETGISTPRAYMADELYPYADANPFDGNRHRLFGEGLFRLGEEMRAKGADQVYWRDYTSLPTWRSLTMDDSPAEYDLYLISTKLITFKQQRSSFNPLLNELVPRGVLEMNPETAHAKGLHDGDEVVITSHNSVTGDTKQVTTHLALSECIRPDTVNLLHHFGNWVHPNSKGKGATANSLFFTGEGYVTNTADQTFHVKVSVRRA